MNKYQVLIEKHQKEFNEFPIIFAFSNEQLYRGMIEKFGFSPDKDLGKICGVGLSGFIRKSDKDTFVEMLERHSREVREAIAQDVDGTGFVKDMFKYELANHEFCITYDYEDTFNALGLTAEEVQSDEKLLIGLKLAEKEYMEEVE